MNNVGLVTFYKDNYGSVLQCYATKYMLHKMGMHCDVIYKKKNLIDKIKGKLILNWKKLLDPKSRNIKIYLTSESRKKIDSFVSEQLNPIGYSERELRTIGNADYYMGFITGSDQVWNLNNYPEGLYFLDFVVPSKRFAFSVSMGLDGLTSHQEKALKRKISKFTLISAREESTSEILERICGIKIETISDPTIMLTPAEWMAFSKEGLSFSEKYIFVHFLDNPSEIVIEYLKKVECQYSKIVVFGYRHRRIEEFTQAQVVDGNPIDYVSLISNASLVLTDSYHTTLFSIYFNKDFHVYKREYQTKFSQNSRIQAVLRLYNYSNRFDSSDEIPKELNEEGRDYILNTQRVRTVDLLRLGIQNFQNQNR